MDEDEDETIRSGRESDCADQISCPEIPFFQCKTNHRLIEISVQKPRFLWQRNVRHAPGSQAPHAYPATTMGSR